MHERLKYTNIVFIVVVIASAITFFFNADLGNNLIQEDGIIEYLTAFILLITSIMLSIKIYNIRLTRGYAWLLFNLFMALGLFFGFGEEISWGQRIFGFTPNEYFAKNNLQYETNIHNLMIDGVKINKLIFS